jgi:hypothetical protein
MLYIKVQIISQTRIKKLFSNYHEAVCGDYFFTTRKECLKNRRKWGNSDQAFIAEYLYFN